MIFRPSQSRGNLLISVPHSGYKCPDDLVHLAEILSNPDDIDWHADRLAVSAANEVATMLMAEYSRYVVDLNRPADDQPLYPGVGTGLVPTETFAGEPLYNACDVPDASEQAFRRRSYWQPYHDRLQSTLDAMRRQHGFAILLDLHSIASRMPRLFDGRLPDLNLGTFDGQSCDPDLESAAIELLSGQNEFSWVVNGRFKGGYITRHYGQPSEGVHALQLEIAQACYMDESNPTIWSAERAAPLVAFLKRLVAILQSWRPR